MQPPDGHQRVHADPRILLGKPVIQGTRIAVELVVRQRALGVSEAELMQEYLIASDDVRACLAYAAEAIEDDRLFATPPAL